MSRTVQDKNPQQKKKKVVIVAMARPFLLDIAGPADVFNFTNKCLNEIGSAEGYEILIASPGYDTSVVASGIEIRCQLPAMEVGFPIDTLIIAGNDLREHVIREFDAFYEWLAKVTDQNTRRIAAVCSGAFALAKVGLLDGRKATTHWDLAEKLKKQYPEVRVNSNPFFTIDGNIYTSAGVSAGIDLALALVEEDFKRDIALKVARQMVFYLNRPGFQTQFGNLLPTYESTNIASKLQQVITDHLSETLELERLAELLNMSVRNLTRVFQKETGMSPAKFVEKTRVESARKLLEDSGLSVESIGQRTGLGGMVSMRRTFLRHLSITPSEYRKSFKNATL